MSKDEYPGKRKNRDGRFADLNTIGAKFGLSGAAVSDRLVRAKLMERVETSRCPFGGKVNYSRKPTAMAKHKQLTRRNGNGYHWHVGYVSAILSSPREEWMEVGRAKAEAKEIERDLDRQLDNAIGQFE